MSINPDQASNLYDLINTAAYTALADDAARLTKLNREPIAERRVTELTLSGSAEGIGLVAAVAVIAELEGTATALQASEDAGHQLLGKGLERAVARLRGSDVGLDLADPGTLALIDQLAVANPSGAIATNQAGLLAMVPTRAKRVLGRDATQADLDAARAVGAARSTYEAELVSARSTYDAAVAAALS